MLQPNGTFAISGKLCLQTCRTNLSCFIEYSHRKLLPANFPSYDIESALKRCIHWICILYADLLPIATK
jgi:hypothetical protein